MAIAATVAESTQTGPELTAIPEDQQPWRPGQNKHGPKSKRFGAQEASEEERQAFMERSAGLSTDDWQRTILYIYQWAPSVDLTRGGRDPKYRKIFTRHMSEEDLKRDLGSGTYELKLNQINPKGQEKTIDRLVISILDFDFPPNLPPGPWLDDPKNADWLWAKPLLEAKYKKPSQPANQSGAGPTWGEMIQFMREERRPDQPNSKDQLMTSVISILPALLQQQNSAQDPSKVIEAMSRVKDLIAQPVAPPPDNTMLQFVLGQLTRLQESNDKLVQALLTQKNEAAKQPDPLSQVESMSKLIAAVAGIAQPAAPKEPWVETVETLGPQVISALDKFATGMAMRNTMQPRPQPGMMPQPRPMTQQPNPAQVIPVQSQPVPQSAGNEPPPPATPATATAPGEPEMDTGLRSMLFQVAVLSANALNLGMDGDQFADQICYKFGQAVYDQFISNVPKETLIDKFKSVTEAWQMVEPYSAQLPGFIDSFYAYATQSDDDETKSISPDEPEDEDEPEPVTAVKSAKKKPKKK